MLYVLSRSNFERSRFNFIHPHTTGDARCVKTDVDVKMSNN